jgi:TolB-like protein/AraC-like DNA-binding protein
MNSLSHEEQDFIDRINRIIAANLGDEKFGVAELANKMGVSRSQIHRRLKSICNKSVSRYIREIRLKKAKEFLEQGGQTVSEIAYKVGFGSPSYFIKSFHDFYGYPPGEVKKHEEPDSGSSEQAEDTHLKDTATKQPSKLFLAVIFILVLLGAYLAYLTFSDSSPQQSLIRSSQKTLMVLPFKNLSSDESNQYFADGVTEDILNQLTKISGLKVLSHTTAEQFRETTLSSPEIAKKMNVSYILEGSIRRQENNFRISVQLTDAEHDYLLWSENYDRQLADIFTIQSNIAKNVANQMQVMFTPGEIKEIEKLHPKNTEAYDNYLMGQYLCLRRDSSSIRKGIEYFKRAIKVDSTYTLAYSGLADGYYALAFTGNIDREKGYDLAYRAAEKALEMDSTLAEAYAVLGVVSYFGYRKWEQAREFLEKAVKVDSNCMVAHLYYCSFLDIIGEPDKALEEVNKAIELEPYYHMTFRMKGIILCNNKRYEESTDALWRSYELNQESYYNYSRIFLNDLALNDDASAVEILQELFSIHPGYKSYQNDITLLYETSGIVGVLKLFLDARSEIENEDDVFLIPSLNIKLGMRNEALTYLERACAEKDRDIPRMIRKPEFESLHSNPRFQALVDTMNLRPYFH